LDPFAHRLERHRNQRGGQDGKDDASIRPHDGADPHHDGHVHRGDEAGHRTVDQRLVDDEVDVVQAVFQDGDAQCHRQGQDRQGFDQRRELADGRRDELRDHDHHGVRDPLELLTLLPSRPHEPNDDRRGRGKDHREEDREGCEGETRERRSGGELVRSPQ
jgi:hypothetical protein